MNLNDQGSSPLLQLRAVGKRYGDRRVLEHVTFCARP